jgi:hypothetical protein
MILALAGMLLAVLGLGARRAMRAGVERVRLADDGPLDVVANRIADVREDLGADLEVLFARSDVLEARITALERARLEHTVANDPRA